MPWEPIASVERLIARVESSSLDFKTVYNLASPRVRYDIAKDVAAFANAYGGTIVVGIQESSGKPVRVEGVADVPNLKETIRDALGMFCVPLPATPEDYVISVRPAEARRILKESCAAAPSVAVDLVTLNVAPDPRAPIGVRPLDGASNRPLADSWRFPVRMTDHTDFLNPTDLPMWMNSHERRVAIHLRRAFGEGGAEVTVAVHCRTGMAQNHPYERPLILTSVDEKQLCATFRMADPPGVLVVPFSFILSVWRAVPDKWEMAINGSVLDEIQSSPGNKIPRFKPYLGGA